MTQALDDKNNTDCGILIDSNMTKDNTNSSISIWIYCLLADCMCALQFYCVSRLCKNLLTIDFENVSRVYSQRHIALDLHSGIRYNLRYIPVAAEPLLCAEYVCKSLLILEILPILHRAFDALPAAFHDLRLEAALDPVAVAV